MVTAGLILLALDASGLINGMMRLWLAFTAEATRSLLG
jgi:hypothetical protein